MKSYKIISQSGRKFEIDFVYDDDKTQSIAYEFPTLFATKDDMVVAIKKLCGQLEIIKEAEELQSKPLSFISDVLNKSQSTEAPKNGG